MQNHPEHDDEPRPERGTRRLLFAGVLIAVVAVLVILHLTGAIGGSST